MNGLHCVGVSGIYEGDEEVAVLVRETESMHKFQIILDFQLILRGSITVRLYAGLRPILLYCIGIAIQRIVGGIASRQQYEIRCEVLF